MALRRADVKLTVSGTLPAQPRAAQTPKLGNVQITSLAVERVGLHEISSALDRHRRGLARVHYVTLWAGGGDDFLVSRHRSPQGVAFRISCNATKGVTTVRLLSEERAVDLSE